MMGIFDDDKLVWWKTYQRLDWVSMDILGNDYCCGKESPALRVGSIDVFVRRYGACYLFYFYFMFGFTVTNSF